MDSRPRLGENGFIFKYVWENSPHSFGNLQYIVTYSSEKKTQKLSLVKNSPNLFVHDSFS